MSRVDDLIDLIQSANEIYLINPARNVRSAYIQIDDLCELVMKSWLQIDTTNRQEKCISALEANNLAKTQAHQNRVREYFEGSRTQVDLEKALGIVTSSNQALLLLQIFKSHDPVANWSSTKGNNRFKNFRDITGEVKSRRPLKTNTDLHEILGRVNERREMRNRLFHDQDWSGVTIDERKCLLAFADLYGLAGQLFETEFTERLQANPVVRAQVAVIKLHLQSFHAGAAYESYQQVLRQRGKVCLESNRLGHEFCALYEDASGFLRKIRYSLDDEILERENKIQRISSLSKPTKRHTRELKEMQEELSLFRKIVEDCLS